MPQVTVYIREEDIEAWRAIDKKSQFMHDVLSDVASLAEPRPTPAKFKPLKVPNIPGLMTAAELNEPECPRHHVAKSMCVGRH